MRNEDILDCEESIKFKSKNHVGLIIGLGFIISIPIIIYQIILADDHGFFIPKSSLENFFVPEFFIHLRNAYEIRCFEENIAFIIVIYFFILGLISLLTKRNDNRIYFRIFHSIITIGLSLIFFHTMVENDITHNLRIRNPIGKEQFEYEIQIFYKLFTLWILLQIIYFILLLSDLLRNLKRLYIK